MPSTRVRGVAVDSERLRREAEARGLTQSDIAAQTKLSERVIAKAFTGLKVDRKTLYAIAAVIDRTPLSNSIAKLIAT